MKVDIDNYLVAGGDLSWPDNAEERQTLLKAVASRWNTKSDFFEDNQDLIVFDEGKEIFGRFRSIITAAKAIRESNPDWWSVGPSIAPNSGEDRYDIEYDD